MNRRSRLRGITCCIIAGVFLYGCGSKEEPLNRPYSFEERTLSLIDGDVDSGVGQFFSEELCVVQDESVYPFEDTTAEAAAVFDISDKQVLYSKNAYEKLHPASITKVMTALIAIKYGNLSDSVTITEGAMITESGATLAGIKPGEVYTLEELLYGLMLPSGNDAGSAIAIHMAGSVEGFAEMMNREAKALGATKTNFVNPHGLTDENHYTTAYDLYLIFNEALKQEKFREITGTTSYTAQYIDPSGASATRTWKGGNWYLVGERETPEGLTVFSGKTGTTKAAGYCLIMASKDQKEQEYISVVLKAPSRPGLYDNMTKIISKIVE